MELPDWPVFKDSFRSRKVGTNLPMKKMDADQVVDAVRSHVFAVQNVHVSGLARVSAFAGIFGVRIYPHGRVLEFFQVMKTKVRWLIFVVSSFRITAHGIKSTLCRCFRAC